MNVFKKNLIPDLDSSSPCYLTTYGAIKSINILGPAYILDLIVPVMEKILLTLDIKHCIKNKWKGKNITLEKNKKDTQGAYENTQNMEMDVNDYLPDIYPTQKINFSLPLLTGGVPIVSSIFSEISNTYVIDSKTAAKVEHDYHKKDEEYSDKLRMERDKKMFYVYYALKVIFEY